MLKIVKIRKSIDKIDRNILKLLAERQKFSEEAEIAKKSENKPIYNKKRETLMLARLKKEAKSLGLSEKVVSELFLVILNKSKEIQQKKHKARETINKRHRQH